MHRFEFFTDNIPLLYILLPLLGKNVIRLEYEAYIPMAISELRKICAIIRNKWAVKKIAIFHRIG